MTDTLTRDDFLKKCAYWDRQVERHMLARAAARDEMDRAEDIAAEMRAAGRTSEYVENQLATVRAIFQREQTAVDNAMISQGTAYFNLEDWDNRALAAQGLPPIDIHAAGRA